MSRAPFQVLVIPYKQTSDKLEFCLFKRTDSNMKIWQWIAGGGESNESFLDSAKRESNEEANISFNSDYIELQTVSSIPVHFFKDVVKKYPNKLVIPEYCFGVKVVGEIILSTEHSEYKWVSYDEALGLLRFDSNKTSLWELNQILKER